MSIVKPLYGSNTAITCTLAPGGVGLAPSSTVGRSCLAIDNSTNLFDDALVLLSIKTGAGAIGGGKQIAVYLFGSQDGTNFEEEESNAPGTDISYTINSPSIFRIGAIIPIVNSAKVYSKVFSIARFFGGVLPTKWGFIICNDTGTALDTTEANHIKQYTGIQYQVV